MNVLIVGNSGTGKSVLESHLKLYINTINIKTVNDGDIKEYDLLFIFNKENRYNHYKYLKNYSLINSNIYIPISEISELYTFDVYKLKSAINSKL